MKVESSRQLGPDALRDVSCYATLTASGFETRARFFTERFELRGCRFRVALGFAGNRIFSRDENDSFFLSGGFELIEAGKGDDDAIAVSTFKRLLNQAPSDGQVPTIVVDYSSMTRSWYGGIIRLLFSDDIRVPRVRCIFNYSAATYAPPPQTTGNSFVGPVKGFCNWQPMDLPVALVLGLGYDRVRAVGLREYVDPAKTVLFYTNPALEPSYTRDVLKNNSELFTTANPRDVQAHPLNDLEFTLGRLVDRVGDLSRRYRVIVAPLGVKPFSLLSMLAVLQFRNADLWRVSGTGRTKPIDRHPSGHSLLYEVVFSQ